MKKSTQTLLLAVTGAAAALGIGAGIYFAARGRRGGGGGGKKHDDILQHTIGELTKGSNLQHLDDLVETGKSIAKMFA